MNKISNHIDLFTNAFHFSAIGMCILSIDGSFLEINSSFCEMVKYSMKELEQMSFQKITHPDDIDFICKKFNKILQEKTQKDVFKIRYMKKNGCIVWGLLNISLTKDEHDEPLYFILQIQDITEQRIVQQKLEKSEDRYRKLIQHSPEPMVIHSEGIISYVNDTAVKLIGAKSYKDLVGKSIVDYIHPEYRELVFQRIEQVLTTNQHLEPYDIKVIDAKGREIDFSISSIPIEYEGKKAIQVSLTDITERKRIEETIRKNEAQYKSLIEYNPDAVFGLDLQGNYTLINESCMRMTGYSKEEFLKMSFHSLVAKEDLEKAMNSFFRALNGSTETSAELKINKKNGRQAIVDITAVPIIIDETIKGIFAIAKDITEHKLIEKRVKQSEERYRALVESSPNGIVVHQEGKIVYINQRFQQFIKATSEDQLIGEHIMRFVHPDYHESVQKRIQQLEKNKSVGSLEEKYILMDGSIVDVEVIATPIEYMDKPAFQVIIQDISKRKEIETELIQSQELYRTVIANIKEVIFYTDSHGIWTFLNPAWEEMTGYTMKDCIGNYFHIYVFPDDREQLDFEFQSLIVGKQEYYRKEVRFLTKDGGYCWVEVVARATFNSLGEVIGTLGTLNDITKRKESEDELKASEELFRLLAEYSSDFISMHDEEGIYLYASPACKEIMQYDVEELIGTSAYRYMHPDDIKTVKSNHEMLLNTGYTVVTYRIRRKDGEYVWFESTITLINEMVSGEQKQIVVSRNISERILVEQRLKEANELLQHLSTIDGLTGVSNRRTFDKRLEMEWNRGLRNSTPLSLIMLDIDYFKAYNDTYGHQGGDGCLKQVAAVIQETLGRSSDLLCRYGGEEFCVILPETNEAGAKVVGEKIRNAIEALRIPHSGSKILPWLTISIGTATMIPSVYTSYMELVSNADKAVYKAKFDGRNCVRSYE